MHKFCWKKSDKGCPGVCNYKYTLSGKYTSTQVQVHNYTTTSTQVHKYKSTQLHNYKYTLSGKGYPCYSDHSKWELLPNLWFIESWGIPSHPKSCCRSSPVRIVPDVTRSVIFQYFSWILVNHILSHPDPICHLDHLLPLIIITNLPSAQTIYI